MSHDRKCANEWIAESALGSNVNKVKPTFESIDSIDYEKPVNCTSPSKCSTCDVQLINTCRKKVWLCETGHLSDGDS